MSKDNHLLERLREGDQKALEKIYLDYKTEFLQFGRSINVDEDVLLDVYQDSIIAFYENVQSGKLTSLSSTLKTYLFSIGKFKLFKINKEAQRFTVESTDTENEYTEVTDAYAENINAERLALIEKALDKLGKKCRELLRLFYYRGFDLEEIKNEMNLENKNTAKSQKSRCISQLKKLIKND
ncbi:MAG: RNA polymerase sigma factor [Cryomorphaceae bacterium]|nr:sigma-70 family RNA polymerase sigma factor [Flavobacteriales bacterium]